MKTRSLSSLIQRKPHEITVDLVKFLPKNQAIIGKYDKGSGTIFIGVVYLKGSKVRTLLRGEWRKKSPKVFLSKDRAHRFPVVSV